MPGPPDLAQICLGLLFSRLPLFPFAALVKLVAYSLVAGVVMLYKGPCLRVFRQVAFAIFLAKFRQKLARRSAPCVVKRQIFIVCEADFFKFSVKKVQVSRTKGKFTAQSAAS